jgi:ribosomal protein S24E
MELKITKEHDNLMLKRKEVEASVSFAKATPSNVEIAKALATKLSASEDVVVVKQILGGFGSSSAAIKAYVYASKEQKDKLEPKIKAKKAADGTAPAAK